MPDEQSRIKEFFEARTQKITQKIEKTPMEKFFLFFLILITIAAVVLGTLQFKQNLEDPLRTSYLEQEKGKIQEKYNINAIANTNQTLSQEEAILLQRKDSDLDGLSDYSEIYLYKTNAYSEDTDGDGLLDKNEILNGTDPLCAEGQDCTNPVEEELVNQPVPANANANDNANSNSNINQPGAVIDLTTLDFAEFQRQLLAGEITLQQLGIDDPEMQKTLDELRAAQNQNLNATELPEEEKQKAIDELKNMSAEEIRATLGAELEKRGLDKSILDQMDDAALKKIFEEALSSVETPN